MSNPNKLHFTISVLDNILIPEKGFTTYLDIKNPNLRLYVTPSGAKTFFIRKRINGKNKRIRIGSYPVFSIEQARKQASVLAGLVSSGKDPMFEKEQVRLDTLTFGEHFKDYMNRYSKAYKKSWKYDETEINKYLSHWFKKRLSDISKSDIQKLHENIGTNNGRYQANAIVRRLSSIFNKAIEWGWNGKNPTIGIKKFKERSRDRFIQPIEMPYLIKALNDEPNQTFKDFFWILLLTGVRKTNALMMRWEQINWEMQEWRIPDSKNDEPILVPLIDEVIKILQERKKTSLSNWVFPQDTNSKKHIYTPRKCWQNILAKATLDFWSTNENVANWVKLKEDKFPSYLSSQIRLKRLLKIAEKEEVDLPPTFNDLRLHDIRRTFGSYQAITGASLQVIGKSLGHKSQHATQIYARLNLDPVRASVKKATAAIFQLSEAR